MSIKVIGNLFLKGSFSFLLNKILKFLNMTKIFASDPVHFNEFGFSVALSLNEDVIAIGSPDEDSIILSSGCVYIFKKINGIWTQTTKLKAINPGTGREFGGAVAMSDDASVLVVGEYKGIRTSNGSGSGVMYIFESSNGDWSSSNVVKIDPFDGFVNDDFSRYLSISGDGQLIASTAVNDDVSFISSGSVYTYKKQSGNWVLDAKFVAPDPQAYGYFGRSVKISNDGSTMIVGASGTETDNGSVYFYNRVSDAWQYDVKISPVLPTGNFGYSVSLNSTGTLAVIGAPEDNGNRGAIFIFRKILGVWTEEYKITLPESVSGDRFGKRVDMALNGDTIVVGYPDFSNNMGKVTIFLYEGGNWIRYKDIIPPPPSGTADITDDQFGEAVSIKNNTILIGSPYDSVLTNILDQGAVYIIN